MSKTDILGKIAFNHEKNNMTEYEQTYKKENGEGKYR
jgi:hypothetical protein